MCWRTLEDFGGREDIPIDTWCGIIGVFLWMYNSIGL
jgi:hypothetical protein